MKKTLQTALLIIITIVGYGQSSQTRFFKDEYLSKEVTERRARFSETVTHNADGTITTEIKNLHRNEVILRNGEPFGLWKSTGKTRDYNFELLYTEEMCLETNPESKPNNYFENNIELGYTAPVIASGETMMQYLVNNLRYPTTAREKGIGGTVKLMLVINEHADIEQLAVYEGVEIQIDKEAMRVIRELKFSEPPKLNGEPIEVCILFPIRFVLN